MGRCALNLVSGGRAGAINDIKCMYATNGLSEKNLGLKDIPMPENPTRADFDSAVQQIDHRQLFEAILPASRPMYYCGRCAAYCPAGKSDYMMEHKPVKQI